jgi:hypothetical protein
LVYLWKLAVLLDEDLDLRVNGDVTGETLRVARETLEHCGGSWRANKNALLLIAPDIAGMSKARATARTLAALRELGDDKYRLARFNTEQRDQLAKRLTAAQERLPQQVTMAYRHLLLLGESDTGGVKLDHIDLGPAKPASTIPGRVLDYLRETDRIIETTLAPAALLSARFGLLPDGTNVAELEALLGFFYRLPRLPKLANSGVLRRALAEGVEKGLFGLASGSAWDAEDTVLRFNQSIDPTEIQFQPGTWLVRAATIRELIAKRQPPPKPEPPTPSGQGSPGGGANTQPDQGGSDAGPTEKPEPPKPANPVGPIPGVAIHIAGVPASKMRDIIRVAVIPLSQASTDVTIELNIHADGGIAGIPRETLNLVVLEGLRQLGFPNVDVDIEEKH